MSTYSLIFSVMLTILAVLPSLSALLKGTTGARSFCWGYSVRLQLAEGRDTVLWCFLTRHHHLGLVLCLARCLDDCVIHLSEWSTPLHAYFCLSFLYYFFFIS